MDALDSAGRVLLEFILFEHVEEDKCILNAHVHASTSDRGMYMGSITHQVNSTFVHDIHVTIVDVEATFPHVLFTEVVVLRDEVVEGLAVRDETHDVVLHWEN